MTTIKVSLKALRGHRVNVFNKRGKGQWEDGEVYSVETNYDQQGRYYNTYRVCLDRRSKAGNLIIIYVEDTQLDKL
jgi:hypothetical protein